MNTNPQPTSSQVPNMAAASVNSAPQSMGPQITTPTPPLPTDPKPASSEKKMALWLIIGLVIIVIIVGGIYFYLSNQQKPLQSNLPVEGPKTTAASENLENDINNVNVDEVDKNFSQVDKDLGSL